MIKFESVNKNSVTVQKVFLGTYHVGYLAFDYQDQTFVYESLGGNRTALFQKVELSAKLALEEKFKE